mmetsp:Transcript_78384/g.181857  ORF Transcript_78384/g.181857 Transcript_78384/m.181857 type:complete len:126 (+) Transcript_78384:57-434(+)
MFSGRGPCAPGWLLEAWPASSSHQASTRPTTPVISGKISGDEVRVCLDGEEEEVRVDGEKGPAWLQLNGTTRQMEGRSDGRVHMGHRSGHEHLKPWSSMGTTERETLLIITAKRQRRLRERQEGR